MLRFEDLINGSTRYWIFNFIKKNAKFYEMNQTVLEEVLWILAYMNQISNSDVLESLARDFLVERQYFKDFPYEFVKSLEDFVNFLYRTDFFREFLDLIDISKALGFDVRKYFSDRQQELVSSFMSSESSYLMQEILMDYLISNIDDGECLKDSIRKAKRALIEYDDAPIAFDLNHFYSGNPEVIVPVAGIPMLFTESSKVIMKKSFIKEYSNQDFPTSIPTDSALIDGSKYFYLGEDHYAPLGSFVSHFKYKRREFNHCASIDSEIHPIFLPEDHLSCLGQFLIYSYGIVLSVGFLPKYATSYFKPLTDILAFRDDSRYIIIDESRIYILKRVGSKLFLEPSPEMITITKACQFQLFCQTALGLERICDVEKMKLILEQIKSGSKEISLKFLMDECYIDFLN